MNSKARSSSLSCDTNEADFFKRVIYPYLVTLNEPVSFVYLTKYFATHGRFFDAYVLEDWLKRFPNYIKITQENGKELNVVEAITKLEFCKDFDGKRRCDLGNCCRLHVCRHYIKGKCNFGKKCKKPHNFTDPSTRCLLEVFCLSDIPEAVLRGFLCRHVQYNLDEMEGELPKELEICHYYNVAPGCIRGNDCPYLHICKFFAQEGACKFSKQCMRSHSFTTTHSIMLIKRYGFDEISVLQHLKEKYNPEIVQNEQKSPPYKNQQSIKTQKTRCVTSKDRFSRFSLGSESNFLQTWLRDPLRYEHTLKHKGIDDLSEFVLPPPSVFDFRVYPSVFHGKHYYGKLDLIGGFRDYHGCQGLQNDLRKGNPFAASSGEFSSKACDVDQKNAKNRENAVPALSVSEDIILENVIPGNHAQEIFRWQFQLLGQSGSWEWLTTDQNKQLEQKYCDVNCLSVIFIQKDENVEVIFEPIRDETEPKQLFGTVTSFYGYHPGQRDAPICKLRRHSNQNCGTASSSWKWYYLGDNKEWICYDDEHKIHCLASEQVIDSTKIENTFRDRDKDSISIKRGYSCFVIDIVNMVERNLDTGGVRKISRRPAHATTDRKEVEDTEKKGFSTHHSWPDSLNHHSQGLDSQKTVTIELPISSEIFSKISVEFYKTMRDFKILKIEAVQNLNLFQTFQSKKYEMEKNLQRKPREKYLYLGLDSSDDIESICDMGFCIGEDCAKYFASEAIRAHEQTRKMFEKTYTIIIARVLIPPDLHNRRSSEWQPAVTEPKRKLIDELFHKLKNDTPLFALFGNSHAYPEYVVKYSFK